jgi:hypothetical protein
MVREKVAMELVPRQWSMACSRMVRAWEEESAAREDVLHIVQERKV